MDITSNQAGELLKITGGALRQIETGYKPASLALAFRASRLYGVSVDELLVNEDKPKDKPKKAEPKIEKVAPNKRGGATGPKRVVEDVTERGAA